MTFYSQYPTIKILKAAQDLPSVLDIFVNAACNDHGNDSIIPGRYEHNGKTQTHSQEGQDPVEEKNIYTST